MTTKVIVFYRKNRATPSVTAPGDTNAIVTPPSKMFAGVRSSTSAADELSVYERGDVDALQLTHTVVMTRQMSLVMRLHDVT